MRIATVCGMGFGTSMMLAMQVRDVLSSEGIAAIVDPVDLGSFKSMPAEIVVAPRDMETHLKGTPARVVLIDNLIDKDEVATKILQAVHALND